jgi:Domain of unknown function (DUF4915)
LTTQSKTVVIDSGGKNDRAWFSNSLVIEPKVLDGVALQDDLLVSAVWKPPFTGGLFALSSGPAPTLRIIDRISTTGVWRDHDTLLRNIYHNDFMILYLYGADGTACVPNAGCKQVHDVRFQFGQFYVVSTGTNEVVQLDADGKVTYRWKFPGENASWHLNCLDLWNGRYVVSCFGRKGKPSDYQGSWAGHGVVFDLETEEVLWSGLSKPHTPRQDATGRQYICDSDTERLLIRNPDGNISELKFPGAFTRGLAFGKEHIYLGLSAIRHRGVQEISADSIPNARIAVIEQETFRISGYVDLPSAEVYEIVISS